MKGLFLKDLIFIKTQFLVILLTFVLSNVCLLIFRSLGPIVSLVVFGLMLAFLVQSTLTFDQQNNGLAFILTLPVTKKEYVLEKYLLLVGFIFLSMLFQGIISIVANIVFSWNLRTDDLLFMAFEVGTSFIIVFAITLAQQIKHGPEIAQVIMSMVGAVIAVVIGGIYSLIKFTDFGAEIFRKVWIFYLNNGSWPLGLFLGCLGIIIVVFSYKNSLKNIKLREL